MFPGRKPTVEKVLTGAISSKKLQMESVLDDIFEDLGEYVVGSEKTKAVTVPDAIFLKLEATPQGARQTTIPFLKVLTGDPTIGATTELLYWCQIEVTELEIDALIAIRELCGPIKGDFATLE